MAGETVTFVVTPDYGYELESLTYTYRPNTSGAFFTIENNRIDHMPATDITVSAQFKLKTLNVTVAANIANGSVTIKDGKTTAITDMGANVPGSGQRYNLMGQPVGPDYRGIVIVDGKKLIVR